MTKLIKEQLLMLHSMAIKQSGNQCDLFGMAGGVSFLNQEQDKKHRIRKLSDMPYIKQ